MFYQKINTIYKRNKQGHIIEGDYVYPEFKNMKDALWDATEKIDGMNMRIIFSPEIKCMRIAGKTDKANIPDQLKKYILDHFPVDALSEYFSKGGTKEVTIFGEGYGPGIRTGGVYRNDQAVILFDINIDGWWMNRAFVENAAKKFNVDVVPYVGQLTLMEAVERVKEGFPSRIAQDKTYIAEGLVLRNPDGLLRRNGERLICKIKHCDFT